MPSKGPGWDRCSAEARTGTREHSWDPFAAHRLEGVFLGSTFLANKGQSPDGPACSGLFQSQGSQYSGV